MEVSSAGGHIITELFCNVLFLKTSDLIRNFRRRGWNERTTVGGKGKKSGGGGGVQNEARKLQATGGCYRPRGYS